MPARFGIDTSILVRLATGAGAGCGLLDRLIADDYRRAELITLDRKMASLRQARRL